MLKERRPSIAPRIRTNEEIRVRGDVRAIGPEGEQLGIMTVQDALNIAYDRGLDLVEIAPQAEPPVVKVMDYGKYKYEENKKAGEARKTATKQVLKELTFRPKIGDHDVEVRTKKAREFLLKGFKVKFTVIYRGRERSHPEIGERVLLEAFEVVKDVGKIESPPVREGRKTFILIEPLVKPAPKAKPKGEEEGKPKAEKPDGALKVKLNLEGVEKPEAPAPAKAEPPSKATPPVSAPAKAKATASASDESA